MKRAYRYVVKFFLGGGIYFLLEMMIRGYSHWTMFILGGMCFVACGIINNTLGENVLVWQKMVWCMIAITVLELVAGVIVNTMLGWHIWDYSEMPMQVMGQICVPFMLVWYAIGFPAIVINRVCDKLFNNIEA